LSLAQPINAYICPKCGVGVVTIDRDEGVTPALIRCRGTPGCDGMARSCWYRPPKDAPAPVLEWYRPTEKEAKRKGSGLYQHFLQGGLFLRVIGDGPPPQPEPEAEPKKPLSAKTLRKRFEMLKAAGTAEVGTARWNRTWATRAERRARARLARYERP